MFNEFKKEYHQIKDKLLRYVNSQRCSQ